MLESIDLAKDIDKPAVRRLVIEDVRIDTAELAEGTPLRGGTCKSKEPSAKKPAIAALEGARAIIKINTARFYKKDGAVRLMGYIAKRVKQLNNTPVEDAVARCSPTPTAR